MSDEEDSADPTKSSKRNRFKGAVTRTKIKLTKRNKENATTVDDFLASGRTSTSTYRPSTSDSLSVGPERQESSLSYHQDANDILHPADSIPPPQPSPRRIVVPKIDVSNSQRYPAAQPVEKHSNETSGSSMLRPEYQGRSRSIISKGRGRARGLSVQFTDRPPIIIGEGGDESETPTIEVGRAKARARSASPQRSAGSPSKGPGRLWNRSPLQQIPRAGTSSPKQAAYNSQGSPQPPPPQAPGTRGPGSIPSPGIKRVQTGMAGSTPSPMSESRQAANKEFEMSMGISPATTNSPAPSLVASADPGTIHAPKPIHPPVAVPNVKEIPVPHELKRENGTKSLRNKFHAGEGNALRDARRGESPVSPLSSSDERFSSPPGPPPGGQPSHDTVSPPSHPGSAYRSPQPPPGPPTNPPASRRPVNDGFPPPPGPPPGRQPVHPHLAPPPHGPPASFPSGQPLALQFFPPPPGPPPGRRPVNEVSGHSTQPPPPSGWPPPPPAPPQRNPDDEYMGWVPDDVNQTQVPSFPGTDASGKLAPFPGVVEQEDAKPGKLKKRWFRRRGS